MKRTIINLITLLVTLFLLVFVVRAWYVTNDKVDITGANGATSSDSFALEIERGVYNNNSWEWVSTNNLAITEMEPGNAFFFRFKITASRSGSFRVDLNNVESSLKSDSFVRTSVTTQSGTSYYASLKNVKMYLMDNSTTVNVLDGDNVSHTLYTYDETTQKFSLSYYKIEDCFKYYDYGVGNSTFFNSHPNAISNDYINSYIATKANATYQVDTTTSNVWYGYFALEFNDALSNISYKHLDGVVKADSNLFLAQVFNIKDFALSEL